MVVDADTLDESFRIDFEEDARDEIAQRVQSASYEFELIHTGEIEGTLEISIAESTDALFSGDSNREVRLTGLVFTPALIQRGELTTDEVLRIAGFAFQMSTWATAASLRALERGRAAWSTSAVSQPTSSCAPSSW